MQHRCPEHIVRLFDGDEQSKRDGRQRAIDWLSMQTVEDGDEVLLPHPVTGVMESFTKHPMSN